MIFDLNLVHSVLVHYHFVLVCIWLKQNNLTAKIFHRRIFWPSRCWVTIYFSVFNIFLYVWYSKPPCGSCFYCPVEYFEYMSWMSPDDDDHGDDDYDDPYSMVMITKYFWIWNSSTRTSAMANCEWSLFQVLTHVWLNMSKKGNLTQRCRQTPTPHPHPHPPSHRSLQHRSPVLLQSVSWIRN